MEAKSKTTTNYQRVITQTIKEKSLLSKVPQNQVDPIMAIMESFKKCKNKDKINLTVGAYRDEELKNYVFKCVRKAENDILNESDSKCRAYLHPTGDEEFTTQCRKIILDDDHKIVNNKRLVSSQGLSGTGCLRLCAQFISKYLNPKNKTVLLPHPTWSNHDLIFRDSGFKEEEYEFFSSEMLGINFDNVIDVYSKAEEGSVVLLHTCAYNPTGADLTKDQWKKIVEVIKEKKLFAILDTAYQGFATGDIVEDAYAIRLFAESEVEFAVCQSFSKNMGLYGERAGALHIVFNDLGSLERNEDMSKKIKYGLTQTALTMHLVPIGHGSEIIKRVIKNYYKEWTEELKVAVDRIILMRKLLYEELLNVKCPGNWEHIMNQKGMFAYTGLNAKQCEYLIEKKNLYLVKSGRISICGINKKNVKMVAEFMKETVENVKN